MRILRRSALVVGVLHVLYLLVAGVAAAVWGETSILAVFVVIPLLSLPGFGCILLFASPRPK